MADLSIHLDRARRSPLAAQIYRAIREAIETGRLAWGARLPSWLDLAVQLGVAPGTVRVAYERLIAEQFAVGLGAAGTRVQTIGDAEDDCAPAVARTCLEAVVMQLHLVNRQVLEADRWVLAWHRSNEAGRRLDHLVTRSGPH